MSFGEREKAGRGGIEEGSKELLWLGVSGLIWGEKRVEETNIIFSEPSQIPDLSMKSNYKDTRICLGTMEKEDTRR